MQWFRSKKKQTIKQDVRDTREVIKDIEEGKAPISKSENRLYLELKTENFIGETDLMKKRRLKQETYKTLAIHQWLPQQKIDSVEKIGRILSDCLQKIYQDSSMDVQMDDLAKKFRFAKLLQEKSGVPISDFKLTVLRSPREFEQYMIDGVLSGKQGVKRPSEPHAIHLNQQSYSSPNIYVIPDITERAKTEQLKKIMNEVETLEEQRTRLAIERAKLESAK